MREIILYGPMRAKFGRMFKLDVSSPAEAINALCTVIPGFRKWFRDKAIAGQNYHIFVGKQNVKLEEVTMQSARDPIRIVPIVHGSGGRGLGIIAIIAGAALMYFTGNPMLFQLGMGLVIGGAAMLLVKVPSTPDPNSKEAEKPDKVFDGAVNVLAAGNCVPLLYGTMEVGSVVASAGIYTEDIAPVAPANVSKGFFGNLADKAWDQ